jgi:hypothetical protein
MASIKFLYDRPENIGGGDGDEDGEDRFLLNFLLCSLIHEYRT